MASDMKDISFNAGRHDFLTDVEMCMRNVIQFSFFFFLKAQFVYFNLKNHYFIFFMIMLFMFLAL